MEGSPLGEYETRWHLIQSFVCHEIIFVSSSSGKHNSLVSLLIEIYPFSNNFIACRKML